jgi:hypothetical protein
VQWDNATGFQNFTVAVSIGGAPEREVVRDRTLKSMI